MRIDEIDSLRDEKLQFNIKRESAKTSALSSGIIVKYGYVTGEEIFHFNQSQIIEQVNLT